MGWMGVIVILASWKDHFIRVGENLVPNQSSPGKCEPFGSVV